MIWINLKNSIDEKILSKISCAIIQKGVKVHSDNYFAAVGLKETFFVVIEYFFWYSP